MQALAQREYRMRRFRHARNAAVGPLVTVILTERKCLRCQQVFPSLGPGNRICKGCSESNANVRMPPTNPGMSGNTSGRRGIDIGNRAN